MTMTMTAKVIPFALIQYYLTLQFAIAQHGHSYFDGNSNNRIHRYSNNDNHYQVAASSEKEEDYAMHFLTYYNNKQRRMFGIELEEQIHTNSNNGHKNTNNNDNNNNNINKNNQSIYNTQSNSYIHTKLLETGIYEPTPPSKFVTLCTNFHLSDQIVSDNEINNDEAASFFEYLCNELPVPACQNKAIPFYSLDIELQMAFVNAICPRDTETNATLDKQCINRLRKIVEAKNQFAYEIDPARDVEADITRYCSSIYSLSTEFHNGTYQPSPVPSMAPSSSPTDHPSSGPTSKPSLYHTLPPSSSPSSSPSPTLTPFPTTLPPSSIFVYQTSFTYMMGFDNELIHDDVLNKERPDIMDATSDAIVSTLTSTFQVIKDRRFLLRGKQGRGKLNQNLRHLQTLGFPNAANKGVEHVFSQNETCTTQFTKSTYCIIMVSQVTLESTSQITKQDVNNAVYTSIRTSMNDDTFRNEVNFIEVKEVKYINDGPYIPVEVPRAIGTIGVGGGSIAGITIGSVLFLIILAFFVGRARARSDEDSVHEDSLSDSENYQDNLNDAEFVNPANADMKKNDTVTPKSRNLPIIEEVEGASNENSSLKESGIQLDTTSGQVIGSTSAGLSYVSSAYSASSAGYSADNPESPTREMRKGDELVDQLDAAVQAGDWAAVAAIAGDLSQADDISTMSSFHSRAGDISYDPSERDNLSEKDAKRAKEIDKLISEGDWNAVGVTAAAFEADADSHGSKEKNAQQKKSTPPQDIRKSILDFISGPWNSIAAAKAVNAPEESTAFPPPVSDSENVEETDESKDEITNAPMEDVDTKEVLSSSEPSDLSVGEGQRGTLPKDSTDFAAFGAIGSVAAVDAVAAASYRSESEATTTDDDTRQLLANEQKKKRSWASRFSLPVKRKNNAKKQKENGVAAKSIPISLQEDSSVSSWSHGDSSPDTSMNLYGGRVQSKGGIDDMPAEMKAFGEDHGLAAAEREMEEEAMRRERFEDSGGELTNKSSDSLRDELDKAIETGDWAAVEKQTNQMLVASDKPSRYDISDVDSDLDTTDGPEGWSQNHSDDDTEVIDDERIEILEKLIEADDWQGIVNNSQIHTKADDSVVHDDDEN